jgi:hypothetical protein
MLARAVAHIHSDWSHDGSWPLAKLASLFRKAGYCCLLTSEHDESFDNDRWHSYRQTCIEASKGQILIIPGIEYSDASNIVHVLAWGDMPFLGKARETESLLREVSELKGLAILAHPSRRDAWQRFDHSWAKFLFGIEQWNRKVDGVAPSGEAMSLLHQNPSLVPFVGLDFHRANQFFPMTMKLEINSVLSEKGALTALREKRVSPEVFGVALKYFKAGIGSGAAIATERARRFVRDMVKKGLEGHR